MHRPITLRALHMTIHRLPFVTLTVLFHRYFRHKQLVAAVAFEVFHLGMLFHVDLQTVLSGEHLVTFGAFELLYIVV